MSATAELLASLDVISHETTRMLSVLDESESKLSRSDRREARRFVVQIRRKAQVLSDWISEARLEEPRN
jgi:hypothetical protein